MVADLEWWIQEMYRRIAELRPSKCPRNCDSCPFEEMNVINRINLHSVGEDLRLYGRVAKPDGTWATPSNVSGVDATIKRIGNDAATVDLDADIATILFDELIEGDPAYTRDHNDARTEPGYNFAWTVPAAQFTSSGWHTIQIDFTFSSGEVTKLLYEVPVIGDVA